MVILTMGPEGKASGEGYIQARDRDGFRQVST
jgi:hypothetical protein